MNLISQNRKRPLDGSDPASQGAGQTPGQPGRGGGGQNGQSDSENVPVTKKTLLATNQQSSTKSADENVKQPNRLPQKIYRPTAANNRANAPEEFFYIAVSSIK